MKSKLLFIFISLSQIMSAQTFTEATNTPFEDGEIFSMAFSDVNGDGFEDVLMIGVFNRWLGCVLFFNDGTGHFTGITGRPFDVARLGSIVFSDVNGDGHEDVLITGQSVSSRQIAKLYINDGTGNFTEKTDAPFKGVLQGSVAFSDVNGDDYEDVLISGETSSGERTANLYMNDGTGHFTEITDTPFDGVSASSIAFADLDGDNSPDVLITGLNSSDDPIAKLYINDGKGEFTEKTNTPIEGVSFGSIAFSDVNGNSYQDLIITGQNSSADPIAKLYINDDTGDFTESVGTPFDGVWQSSVAFSDVNGDGHEDLIITGRNSSSDPITKLYINDGTGSFTERTDTPFEGVTNSSVAFSDVNGDGHDDLLISGRNSSTDPTAKLYINDGVTNSSEDFIPGFDLELKAYPNPTSSNRVNLRFESTEIGYAQLGVYDVNGHLLRTQKELSGIGKQTLCMDVASLPPGSYFIQLNKGKRKGVARFVVQ